jgi:hypothetical protein
VHFNLVRLYQKHKETARSEAGLPQAILEMRQDLSAVLLPWRMPRLENKSIL